MRISPAAGIAFKTQARGAQPACGFSMRAVEAGNFTSLAAGRTGRRTSSPPQFGQRPPGSRWPTHSAQNVHSNEQISASAASAGKSLLQHSQLGLSSSIGLPFRVAAASMVGPSPAGKGG
jgi:hypothetical protein